MKGFIEVTEKYDGFKVLYPTDKIMTIIDNGSDGTFIETGYDRKGESTGICIVETFSEVKAKLSNCEM